MFTVIRVECSECHRGPYVSYHGGDSYCPHWHTPPFYGYGSCPTPDGDCGIEREMLESEACAFWDVDQLRKWWNGGVEPSDDSAAALAVYLVPAPFLTGSGESQVLFTQQHATRLCVMDPVEALISADLVKPTVRYGRAVHRWA